MTTVYDTPQKIAVFRAITIRRALLIYDKTKSQVNTAYTPRNMLLAATQITGQKFQRGQYKQAAAALDEWIRKQSE